MVSLNARIEQIVKLLHPNRCPICGPADSPPAIYTDSDDMVPLELMLSNGKALPCRGGKIPEHCPQCGRRIQRVGLQPQEARLLQGLSFMSEFEPDGVGGYQRKEIAL